MAGDDAFRFRHLLIRDSAYEGLPKAVRAELHERFADWLGARGGLIELDEIVGYHLEQAVRHRTELDPGDQRVPSLAARAATRLGAAGRAAFAREDIHATQNLLGRAAALLPDGPGRRALLPDLAHAAIEAADRDAAVALLDELGRGDAADRATALALNVLLSPPVQSKDKLEQLLSRLDEAQATFERSRDATAIARCEEARAWLHWAAVNSGPAHRAWLRALTTLREAGIVARQRTLTSWVVNSAFAAGLSFDEIGALLDELQPGAADSGPYLAATLRATRGRIEYEAGQLDLDGLREATREELALAEQMGQPLSRSISPYFLYTYAPWLEGDSSGVEEGRRRMIQIEEQLGTNLYLANVLAEWGISLSEVGDAERALAAVARGREVMERGDLADEIALDVAEAYARARLGEAVAALALMDRARRTAAETDSVRTRDEIDWVDARVRATLGDVPATRVLLTGLAERAEERGFFRYADRYRRDLAALG